MKKLFLFLIMAISIFTSYAGEKTFAVVEGNPAILKDGGNVFVSFDFDGATYDMKEPLSAHYSNLSELVAKVPSNFMAGFSEKAKKSKIVDNKSDAKYSIVVKVDNMDCYYKVMSIVPGHNTKVWGNVTIIDNETGQPVCIIKITECEGGRDFSVDDSFGKCFTEIGETIGKLMNKGKL